MRTYTHTLCTQRRAPSDAHRHTHTVEAASPGSPPHPSIIIILGRAEHLPIAQGWLTWNSAAHLVNAQYDAFSRTISSLCKAWWNFATRNFCSGYRANSPRSHCLFSRLNQSGFWAGVFLYIFFPFFFLYMEFVVWFPSKPHGQSIRSFAISESTPVKAQ